MIDIISAEDLAASDQKFRFLTELIGTEFDILTYNGDVSVTENLSRIDLIEIWTKQGKSKFQINSRIFEIDFSSEKKLSQFINYLSEKDIKFRILDDGVYLNEISIDDTRFLITIINQIDFYFDFLSSEKAFQLTKIGIREAFIPKATHRPKS